MIDNFRASAELIIGKLKPLSGIDFGCNRESVAWLEDYIEGMKDSGIFANESQRGHLIDAFGAFLGECIIHCYGGSWTQNDKSWCVAFNERNAVFPFAKVEKQIDNGLEEGINGFFEMIPVVFAKYIPGMPQIAKPAWYPFDEGKTLGQHGSEEGVIVRDEEHGDGARITLEREGDIAPYSITCGIHGWAVHTRFFDTEPEARREFEAMKDGIATILAMIPLKTDPEVDAKSSAVTKAISKFVGKFP